MTILFADIRAFTSFSEKKLPSDVVFVLNQYFRTMGATVEQAGGQLDKFIGDGVMALFGIEGDSKDGCRAAIQAARRMAWGLKELNENLKQDLPEPLHIGIGIHVGSVIVGDMGCARTRSVTAIGDPVNTASRLEALNKDHASQLIVSAEVAERAGYDMSAYRRKASWCAAAANRCRSSSSTMRRLSRKECRPSAAATPPLLATRVEQPCSERLAAKNMNVKVRHQLV